MTRVRKSVGVIGCGNISGTYLRVMPAYEALEVVACADEIPERAAAQAAAFGVPRSGTPAQVLAMPEIDIVVNLTPPAAHGPVARAALEAGKSVYNEKPLAVDLEEGRELVALAADRALRIGSAPDTFLGASLQSCRAALDEGAIGQPVAATAFLMSRGPDRWHPSPDFFYQPGGGPLFDMGPYYLTALVSLLGPVARVAGMARASFPERIVGGGERPERRIPVAVSTHVAGVLEFDAGVIATLIMSFDVVRHGHPPLEIYGSDGTLRPADPNNFGDAVQIWRGGGGGWETLPLLPGAVENSRGLGVADMAEAMVEARPHRASGDLALHVLEVMTAVTQASESGETIEIESRCVRPAPLPVGAPARAPR